MKNNSFSIFQIHVQPTQRTMPATVQLMYNKNDNSAPATTTTTKKRPRMKPDTVALKMEELVQIPDFEPDRLSKLVPHPRDASIQFVESTHTYYVQFVPGEKHSSEHILSVSGLVHHYFPSFNAEEIVKKLGPKTRNLKYKGMTNEEIIHQWTESGRIASEIGTKFHFLLECSYNGMDLTPFHSYNVVQQFLHWRNDWPIKHSWVPFRTEMRLFTDLSTRVTGTADALFAHEHQDPSSGVLQLIMVDWKFSKEIKRSNFFERGFGVCAGLDNCNYSTYQLQQNMYKYILEHFYFDWEYKGHTYAKVSVVKMMLAVFHDVRPDYEAIELPDCQLLIGAMLKDRKGQMAQLVAGKVDATLPPSHTVPCVNNTLRHASEEGEEDVAVDPI